MHARNSPRSAAGVGAGERPHVRDVPDQHARADALLALVRDVVAEVRPNFPAAVALDASLDRDLGLDSLTRVELLVRIERAFSVRLPETVLGTARTVRDLLNALETVAPPERAAPVTLVPGMPPVESAPATVATLTAALLWHAERHPDRAHMIYTDGERERERMTYGDLAAKSEVVARALAARRLDAGDRVALMLPTGLDFLACFFGIVRAGATPVPLYPPAGTARIADHLEREAGILSNSGARILVTLPDIKPLARILHVRLPDLSGVVTPAELLAPPRSRTIGAASDVALLQYTSGSTGQPKGVVLTHANLLANIRAMGRATRIQPSDVTVSWLPLYHDMGLIGAWLGSLYYGIPLVLMSPLNFLQRPHAWLRSIHRYRGTLSGGPNFAYELCVKRIVDGDLTGVDLSSWRFAFNGAEPVSAATIARFIDRFAAYGFDPRAMAPVYGLAECSVGLAFPPPGRTPLIDRVDRRVFLNTGHAEKAAANDPDALSVVACGVPLPEHRIRIVDASGALLPERREGRIEFAGPSATSGYFRNEALTRALLHDAWLDTGDLGYLAEGELYPTSRVKDIIIRAGRHLHPYELEEAVGRLPGMRQGCAVVFGAADANTGTERLVVVAETRERDETRREALRARIMTLAVDLLGAPADEVVLARPHTIPKTSSGKLRRSETRLLFEHGALGAGTRGRLWQLWRFAWDGLLARLRYHLRAAGAMAYGAYAWTAFGVAAVVATGVLTLPWSLTQRQRIARRLARGFLAVTGLMPRVSCLERLPAGTPCIIVANHASYLDGIVVLAALPPQFRFVAKRGLADSLPLRLALRLTGAILVDRLDAQAAPGTMEDLVAALADGSLAIFPEGTFARNAGVLPFYLGAFVAAARTGRPVVPVTLTGTRSVLRDGSWLPRYGALSVVVGTPLAPAGNSFEAAVKLRDDARACIMRACGEPDLA